jgi:hypothetical protein
MSVKVSSTNLAAMRAWLPAASVMNEDVSNNKMTFLASVIADANQFLR